MLTKNSHVRGPRGLIHPPHWRRAKVQIISLKEERAEYKGRPERLEANFIKNLCAEKVGNKSKNLYYICMNSFEGV